MNLNQVLQDEKVRLNGLLEDINTKKAELDKQAQGLRQELKAIEAYESATGKAKAPKKARKTGGKQLILDAVKEAGAAGIKRAELLVKLGYTGNKSKEQSASNTLASLKKAGTITSEGGLYKVA